MPSDTFSASQLAKLSRAQKAEIVSVVWTEKDFTPLRSLPNLTTLISRPGKIWDESKGRYFTERVDNISSLEGLTNLTCLDLSDNWISRLDPLEKLWKLEKLYLECNNVRDLTPLSQLENLKVLHVGFSRFGKTRNGPKFTSLRGIEGLWRLRELHVGGNPIESLDPIKNLPNLRDLVLSQTSVFSLEVLRNHKSLRRLYVDGTLVTKFDVLSTISTLNRVHASEGATLPAFSSAVEVTFAQ